MSLFLDFSLFILTSESNTATAPGFSISRQTSLTAFLSASEHAVQNGLALTSENGCTRWEHPHLMPVVVVFDLPPSDMFLAKKTALVSTAHPFLFSFFSILPSLIALLVLVCTSSIRIVPPTLSAYIPRNAPQIRLHHAVIAAKRAYPIPAPRTLQLKVHQAKLSISKSVTLLLGPLNVSRETIRTIANLEKIVTKGEWGRICWFDSLSPTCVRNKCASALSILSSSYLYGIHNEHGELCGRKDDVSREDVDAFKQSLQNDSFSNQPSLVAQKANLVLLRSIFPVGLPFEGFKSDQKDGQEDLYESWVDRVASQISEASTEEVPSVVISVDLMKHRIGQQVSQDTVLAFPAAGLVFCVLWWHTGSFFLSCVSLLQTALAFPLAYLIYTYVLRQAYFSALQIFAIFLLLGIGADDVFVFTDAWKQAPIEVQKMGLRERMRWTYHRAVTAMFTTTITTAVAFIVTATSPIMPMSTFGVWAAVLIIVQFLMVITVYPCALVVWQKYFRGTRISLSALGPRERNSDACEICIPLAWCSNRTVDGELRWLERFFQGAWVSFVQFMRISIVVTAIAIFGVAVFLALRLEPPNEEPQFLPDGHPLTIAKKTIETEFRNTRNGRLVVDMTWGILDINREGTSRFDMDEVGTVVMDKTFDLKQNVTQRHIATVCKLLRDDSRFSSTEFAGSLRVSCWIEDFIRWKRNKGRAEFETYNNDASLLFDVLSFATFRNTINKQPFVHYLVDQTILISTDLRRIVSCNIRIISPNFTNIAYQEMGNIYAEWQHKLVEINADGSPFANKAIVTGGEAWVGQVTQQRLVRTMMRSILLMLLITTLTLSITTLNVGVSFIATFCLAGIISSLLAAIYILGWHIGVTESIITTLALGYSFDGIAHIAMAYTQSSKTDRLSKTQDALTTLGISIVYGAVSTLCSAAVLLLASIFVFSQLAKLVIITISLTLVWSILFLPAFLILIGPQNEFLSLTRLLPWVKNAKTSVYSPDSFCTGAVSSEDNIVLKKAVQKSMTCDERPT